MLRQSHRDLSSMRATKYKIKKKNDKNGQNQ